MTEHHCVRPERCNLYSTLDVSIRPTAKQGCIYHPGDVLRTLRVIPPTTLGTLYPFSCQRPSHLGGPCDFFGLDGIFGLSDGGLQLQVVRLGCLQGMLSRGGDETAGCNPRERERERHTGKKNGASQRRAPESKLSIIPRLRQQWNVTTQHASTEMRSLLGTVVGEWSRPTPFG